MVMAWPYLGSVGEEEGADMCGPHVSDGVEKGGVAQRRKPKKKMYSDEDAMGVWACWAGWVSRQPGKRSGLAQLGWAKNKEGFIIRFEFRISMDFENW
jgi:hypothetical protein